MPPFDYSFEEVLELFESHGWKLRKIWGVYRVFMKPGELPWLIPVKGNRVDTEYVEKVKQYFKEEQNKNRDAP